MIAPVRVGVVTSPSGAAINDILKILRGRVEAFRSKKIKIPQMGWNSVRLRIKHPLLKGIPDESYFYFVHSFYAVPEDKGVIAGTCQYGREKFPAMIGHENVFATQFHPEKSQEAGLRLLQNFLEW